MDRKEYRVGRFILRPHRQLLDGEGPVAIGRKALELLSVLAEAGGELVTKDELMAAVWPDAVIEENAIQVHVATLRKALGADGGRLKTAHGLGYRLELDHSLTPRLTPTPSAGEGDATGGGAATSGPDPPTPATGESARQTSAATGAATMTGTPTALGLTWRGPLTLAGGAAVLAAAAVLGLASIGGGRVPASSTVRVAPLRVPRGDGPAAVFADGLAADLAHLAEVAPAGVTVADSEQTPGGADTAMVLDGEARSVGGRLYATLYLHAARQHSIIWSRSFDEPLGDAAAVRDQAAVKLADVLNCLVHGDDGQALDRETLRLYLLACDWGRDVDAASKVRDVLRRVVARAPGLSHAWSMLAITSADQADDLPPDLARTARAESIAAAARALALDPHNAQAWAARSMLSPGLAGWSSRDADLARATEVDPDNPQAPLFRAVNYAEVGRQREALVLAKRAAFLDPLSPFKAALVADDLATTGDYPDALAQIALARRLWPHDPFVASAHLHLFALFGDPAQARRLLDDPASLPAITPSEVEFWRQLVTARSSPTKSPQAAAYFLAHAGRDLPVSLAVQGLAAVGHVDQAYDLIDGQKGPATGYSAVFWRPFMARFRASPRFMPLATRLGLVRIWRSSGKWPDFCLDRPRPYDCEANARVAEMAPPPPRAQS